MKWTSISIFILSIVLSACCGKDCPTGFHCEETYAGLGSEECVVDGTTNSGNITSLVSDIRLSTTGDIRVYLNAANATTLSNISAGVAIRKGGITGPAVSLNISLVSSQEYILLNSPISGQNYYIILNYGAFATSTGLQSKKGIFEVKG